MRLLQSTVNSIGFSHEKQNLNHDNSGYCKKRYFFKNFECNVDFMYTYFSFVTDITDLIYSFPVKIRFSIIIIDKHRLLLELKNFLRQQKFKLCIRLLTDQISIHVIYSFSIQSLKLFLRCKIPLKALEHLNGDYPNIE